MKVNLCKWMTPGGPFVWCTNSAVVGPKLKAAATRCKVDLALDKGLKDRLEGCKYYEPQKDVSVDI